MGSATATIAELLLERGRQAGESRRRQGESSAKMWTSVGDIIANTTGQIAQERAQAPIRAQEAEARALQLEGLRSDAASREADAQVSASLKELFSRPDGFSQEELFAKAGPERGMKIMDGFAALQDTKMQRFKTQQEIVAATLAGMDALPEDLRAEVYPSVRQNLVERQIISQQDAPEAYDPAWFQQARSFGQSQPKAPGTREVKVRNADGSETIQIVADTPGQEFQSAAEVKPDTRSLQIQANDALKRGDTKEYQRIKGVIKELADAARAPESAGSRGLTPNAESQLITRIARDWTTATKPTRELDRQVGIMREGIKAAERGDLAQGGQAILVTFQKILDPTSVVRESEFDRSREGQSLMQRAQGAMERLVQGGPGVPISELKKYAVLAEQIASAQRDSRLKAIQDRLGRVADRYGIPRELVFEAETATQSPPSATSGRGGGMPSYQDYLNRKGGG